MSVWSLAPLGRFTCDSSGARHVSDRMRCAAGAGRISVRAARVCIHRRWRASVDHRGTQGSSRCIRRRVDGFQHSEARSWYSSDLLPHDTDIANPPHLQDRAFHEAALHACLWLPRSHTGDMDCSTIGKPCSSGSSHRSVSSVSSIGDFTDESWLCSSSRSKSLARSAPRFIVLSQRRAAQRRRSSINAEVVEHAWRTELGNVAILEPSGPRKLSTKNDMVREITRKWLSSRPGSDESHQLAAERDTTSGLEARCLRSGRCAINTQRAQCLSIG